MANAKIINVSDKPFEWTFDSGNYGPLRPGEVMEVSADVAAHAIKRSEIIDPDFGDSLGFAIAYVGALDKEAIKKIAKYPCPLSITNQCNAAPFKSLDDLKVHMESHWGKAPAASEKK